MEKEIDVLEQNEKPKFKHLAIVELFGHQQIAGKITEESIGDSTFIRVDVPPTELFKNGYTKFFHPNAIYAITPVSGNVLNDVLKHDDYEPVKRIRFNNEDEIPF